MFQSKKLLSLMLPLMIAAPTLVSAKNNKQLAGPPEEIEFMRPASPELNALSSKTALIPISLLQNKNGNWNWDADLPVDSKDFSFIVFSNGSKNWQIEMVNPQTNKVQDINDLATEAYSTKYGMEQNIYSGEKFTFSNMNTGNWNIRVNTDGEPDQFEGFILLANKSKFQLNSYKTNLDQIVDHNIHFVTKSTSNENMIEALKDFNPINSALMSVTYPDGSKHKAAMYDDGLHGDNLANDGLFGGDFKATEAGGYTVQISAKGTNPNGTPFFRTTEHYVPVIEQTITMENKKATGFSISNNRLNISMPVQKNDNATDGRYRIIAEVWGSDIKGAKQPVSWISTITDVVDGQLNIELDARWISMSKAKNSFELRNLRIEDANHFIPLISESKMDLKIASMPKSTHRKHNGNINQEMMMGKRPVNTTVAKAGAKLLLVHGYCSSDVWGSNAGQFSDSSTFYDLNQNRSHDEFAIKIRDFGAQYNSFGVVAHSQGGAASLHLYTYYWSGLDYSSGSRMIQTVGTPYAGTPLAGNLASLGQRIRGRLWI